MVPCVPQAPAWTHDIFLDAIASGLIVESAACSFVLNPQAHAPERHTHRSQIPVPPLSTTVRSVPHC